MRRHEITRLEALSDAVFAFAATLLVVALEVPKIYPELVENLRGFLAFGLSFAMLVLIWVAHNGFFRRYGMQDGGTVVLNSLLLFGVLFYVYPLKFLATTLVASLIGHGVAPRAVYGAMGVWMPAGARRFPRCNHRPESGIEMP